MAMPVPTLLSVFPTFVDGGAQMRFATIANAMGVRWRHMIVSMDGRHDCRARLDPQLEAVFPVFRPIKGDAGRLLLRIKAALRAWQPDLLLTHNWGSIEWGLANLLSVRRVPHLHAEDGFGPEERARQLPRRVWARRLALRHAAVALPSLTLMGIARERWRLPEVALHHIPNGIDVSRFTPRTRGTPPSQWGLSAGGIVIGTVAALRPEKNLGRLIDAVASARNSGAHGIRLVIAGEGTERASLERLAQAALGPGHYAFLGHTADPAPVYQHLDVFGLSSDTEQMPLSLLEAMASGLPVVSTDVGDVKRMVAEANRPFITRCDAAGLAAALGALATRPGLAKELGGANRALAVERYDQRRMIEDWAALFDRTIQASRLGR